MSEAPQPNRELGPEKPPAPPLWVGLLVVGFLVVVMVTVLAMLFMGGDHGPGRHGG